MAEEVKLRSNMPYGSSPWANRRTHFRALGLTDEQMELPKIAIVNSSSDLAVCFAHLDGIVPKLKAAIAAAGGVGFEIRTTAPSDFITSVGREGRYILPSRDLIAGDIESAVEGAMLDGMVCLVSCDKTTPGHLMAAARMNIPTVIVPCGYQTSGHTRDGEVDIEDVFLGGGLAAGGQITVDQLRDMADHAVTSPGVCQGMGTANTMHIAAEALGMTMPGAAPARANGPRMWRSVDGAGRRIIEMVREGLRPRDILTPASFRNAVKVMLSASGSINSVKHLQAIAVAADVDIDIWGEFERLGRNVPLLIDVKPNGNTTVDAFDAAGGAAALMTQLSPLLELEAPTVTGVLRERLGAAEVLDEEVVRPLERPLGTEPTIVIVRGSLAPEGAIVKRAVVDARAKQFEGTAIVFHGREEALAALRAGRIRPGHVAVLSGIGPKGGPGMNFMSGFIFAVEGAGLAGSVAIVTDGQLSGLVNKCMVVGEVAPEAAVGGPLAFVQDGDRIRIDVEKQTVDLEVAPDELAQRTPWSRTTDVDLRHSWLSVYADQVGPSSTGLTVGARARGEA